MYLVICNVLVLWLACVWAVLAAYTTNVWCLLSGFKYVTLCFNREKIMAEKFRVSNWRIWKYGFVVLYYRNIAASTRQEIFEEKHKEWSEYTFIVFASHNTTHNYRLRNTCKWLSQILSWRSSQELLIFFTQVQINCRVKQQ